ncbi:DUF5954 family protein [Actinomadura craniellae]|nr:DUF5954 family protein [Actinomadura craniellae]
MVGGDGDALAQEFRDLLATVDPVAAVAAADACRASDAYPGLSPTGPMFTAAERVPGGWRVLLPCTPVPQDAREALGGLLRADAAARPDAEGRGLRAAAAQLEERRLDALTLGTRRLRVVRVEQVLRIGLDGPEAPRPTDHDPATGPGPAELLPVPPPAGAVAAEFDARLLAATTGRADDAERRAFEDYPEPVFLRPAFAVAEHTEGRWRITSRAHSGPGAARGALAFYFRHLVPVVEQPDEIDRLEYSAAADLMDDPARRAGITVLGRRFRIVRLERAVRMGPDGPEPPRPSDFDPR